MAEYVESADDSFAEPELVGYPRVLDRTATAMAMFGGGVFCVLIVMSLVSIIGRKLFATPVQGDVELMQMGAAIGAAAFLPLCEMHDHNIKVDALTSWMSVAARAVLDTLAHLLLTVAAGAITWRTVLAAIDSYSSGEVSTLLTIPMWQAVVLLVPSFALLTLCGLYQVTRSYVIAKGSAS